MYCSVRKRQMNICYVPNCSATLYYFNILGLETFTHFHHQLAPVSIMTIPQCCIFELVQLVLNHPV